MGAKYWILAVFICLPVSAQDRKLVIDSAVVSVAEDGLAVPSGFQFQPGDIVFFSCRVSGFGREFSKEGEEQPRMHLSYRIEALDANSVPIISEETGKIAADLAAEDKKWQPRIRHSIALPPLADSGRYQITVHVKDEISKTEGEAKISFLILGRTVPPSDTLVVRNFRFLRAEEDKDPLAVAAYRPGDVVWARFDMTGYKLGGKNAFDLEYGLQALRPNGEKTYEALKAAAEKNESFYPQRYTPGILSLTLPSNLVKGEYTIVLLVRDNLGKQNYETRQKFTVE